MTSLLVYLKNAFLQSKTQGLCLLLLLHCRVPGEGITLHLSTCTAGRLFVLCASHERFRVHLPKAPPRGRGYLFPLRRIGRPRENPPADPFPCRQPLARPATRATLFRWARGTVAGSVVWQRGAQCMHGTSSRPWRMRWAWHGPTADHRLRGPAGTCSERLFRACSSVCVAGGTQIICGSNTQAL